MNRYYKPITKVLFKHNFYLSKGELCADFEVTPSAETASILRNHRMTWGARNRTAPSEYTLFAEHVGASMSAATPLIALPSAISLTFGMQLKNPNLVNFTVLDTKSPKEVYILSNSGVLDELIIEVMELVPSSMQIDGLADGDSIAVVPPPGTANFDVDAQENGDSYSAILNFLDKPEGIYELTLPGSILKRVFVSPELYGKGLFGILHLQNGSGNTLRPTYTFNFESREVFWHYFVILRGPGHSGWIYSIDAIGSPTFQGFTFPVPPPPPEPDPVPPPPVSLRNVANELLPMINSTDTLLGFISSSDTAYSDVVRSSIALGRKFGPSGDLLVVISNLPNPALGSATATVVVSVDPPPA